MTDSRVYCQRCPKCKGPLAPGKFDECKKGHVFWAPFRGPQEAFLRSNTRELLYGGAAGGGKTAASVMLPLRWVKHPRFQALVLRRETTDLTPLLTLANRYYPTIGGSPKSFGAGQIWRFPSGAVVRFAHCKDEADSHNFDGDEYQVIDFDELAQFTQKQYYNIVARLRGAMQGLPRWIRCTTNPPDVGQGEWVFTWWGAWLNPDFRAKGLTSRPGKPPLEPSQVVWITKDIDGNDCYITNREVAKAWNADPARADDDNYAQSRSFIPALAKDNLAIMANDKEYVRSLGNLDPVRAQQLRDGNWLVRPAPGSYFRRAWIGPPVPASDVPKNAIRIRFWDRAASAKEDGSDPDWTVGLLLAFDAEQLYVESVVRFRGPPGEVEETIIQTALVDGPQVLTLLSIDPGQAGLVEAYHLEMSLQKHNIRFDFVREVRDKISRANPISTKCRPPLGKGLGRMRIVEGHWNRAFLDELEAFPVGAFDDQVDALSGAYSLIHQSDPSGGGQLGGFTFTAGSVDRMRQEMGSKGLT